MKRTLVLTAVATVLVTMLSGCYTSAWLKEYEQKKLQAQAELPKWEQAYRDKKCDDLRYGFMYGDTFSKAEAKQVVECLDIERTRDEYRGTAKGVHQDEEVIAEKAYLPLKQLFAMYANGKINLQKTKAAYKEIMDRATYLGMKEVSESNAFVRSGMENAWRARQIDEANRRDAFRAITQPVRQPRGPVNTTCRPDGLGGMNCTTY